MFFPCCSVSPSTLAPTAVASTSSTCARRDTALWWSGGWRSTFRTRGRVTPVALFCPLPSSSALPTLWLRWRPGLVLRVLLLRVLLLLLLLALLRLLLLHPLPPR
jgi:hypothetical protein